MSNGDVTTTTLDVRKTARRSVRIAVGALVAGTLAANFFWTLYQDSTAVFAKLLYLLPPMHRTDEVYAALAKGEPLPWPLIEWFAGYGVVCFVVGLVVLRYRRLAIV